MSQDIARRAEISVIIPCYRCVDTINRAVESVASQTMLPGQLILVEDGSPDSGATLAELKRLQEIYAGLFAIDVVPLLENVGVAGARNAGWGRAIHPYIAFLDADDAWHPKKLEIQHGYLRDHPEIMLCGHGHRWMKHDGVPDWELETVEVTEIDKVAMLMSNRFVTPSVMLRSEVVPRFMSGRRYMEDHLLWSQIICSGMKVARLDTELVAIYKHPYADHGLSSDLWQMARADIGNYRILNSRHMLGTAAATALMLYALLKFFRRIAIISVRRLVSVWGRQTEGAG